MIKKGQIINNRYKVTEDKAFGSGGFGEVWRAEDQRLSNKLVAIKVPNKETTQQSLQKEIDTASKLPHPSIIDFYDNVLGSGGSVTGAMRLIPGNSLEQEIESANKKANSLLERFKLFPRVVAACHAVAYAHKKNYVHRDLKPGNIMVGTEGETIVIDWGEAHELNGGPPTRSVASGGYTAPDVITNLKNPDWRPARTDDVYSLGATLWSVVTGSVPSWQATAQSIEELKKENTLLLRTLRRSPVSKRLINIIAKAMSIKPSDRHPDAGVLAGDLEKEFLAPLAKGKGAWPLIIGGLGLLGLLGALAWWFWSDAKANPIPQKMAPVSAPAPQPLPLPKPTPIPIVVKEPSLQIVNTHQPHTGKPTNTIPLRVWFPDPIKPCQDGGAEGELKAKRITVFLDGQDFEIEEISFKCPAKPATEPTSTPVTKPEPATKPVAIASNPAPKPEPKPTSVPTLKPAPASKPSDAASLPTPRRLPKQDSVSMPAEPAPLTKPTIKPIPTSVPMPRPKPEPTPKPAEAVLPKPESATKPVEPASNPTPKPESNTTPPEPGLNTEPTSAPVSMPVEPSSMPTLKNEPSSVPVPNLNQPTTSSPSSPEPNPVSGPESAPSSEPTSKPAQNPTTNPASNPVLIPTSTVSTGPVVATPNSQPASEPVQTMTTASPPFGGKRRLAQKEDSSRIFVGCPDKAEQDGSLVILTYTRLEDPKGPSDGEREDFFFYVDQSTANKIKSHCGESSTLYVSGIFRTRRLNFGNAKTLITDALLDFKKEEIEVPAPSTTSQPALNQ